VWLLLASSAQATVPDLYGTGGWSMGAGTGGASIVVDGAAARLNPAGLNGIDEPEIALGFSAALPSLLPVPDLWWDTDRDGVVTSADPPLAWELPVEDAIGLHLNGGRDVGGRFGIGFSVYVPANRLLQFAAVEPELPTWFQYGHRQERFALAVGLGGEVLPGFSVGASVDVIAAARVTLYATLDATIDAGGVTTGDTVSDLVGEVVLDVHDITFEVVPDYAPIIGAVWDLGPIVPALEGLRLAGTWRGSAGLLIAADLDVQANVAASGIGDLDPFVFAALLDLGVSVQDHYVPGQAVFSIGYARPGGRVYAEGRWTAWERMQLNVARIDGLDLTSPLVDIDDKVVDGSAYSALFASVLGGRAGGELLLPPIPVGGRADSLTFIVRGGGGFEPSPLVDQSASSAILDADRVFGTAGLGLRHGDPFALVQGPVHHDLAFQYHHLARGALERSSDVPTAGYPVDADSLPIGGHVIVLMAEVGFAY
jgi:hypothetical protein